MNPHKIMKAAEDRERDGQLQPTVNGVKNAAIDLSPLEYAELVKTTKEQQQNAGKAGCNEYGVPLHACNGHIQNAHYWAWIGEKNRLNPLDWIAPRRSSIKAEIADFLEYASNFPIFISKPRVYPSIGIKINQHN